MDLNELKEAVKFITKYLADEMCGINSARKNASLETDYQNKYYSRRINRISVRPNSLPYFKENGWTINGNIYQGYYRCRYGAWRGWIEKGHGEKYNFYIHQPPDKIFTGPHGPCFTSRDSNWCHVHFKVDSYSVDSGIMAIERILSESLGGRQ